MTRRLLVAPLLALALTACGTTVPLAQQGTQAGGSTTGLGGATGTTTGDGSTTGAPLDVGSGTGAGGTSTRSTSGGSTPLAGGSGGTGGSSTPAPSGSGIGPGTSTGTKKPLVIGISTIDYSELARQFGAELPSAFYDAYKNLIAAINKRGGLNGRQVKAIYHTQNGAATSYANEAQQTCAAFTQDNKVDVVLTYIMAQPTLSQCLKNKGVTQIDNQQYAMTDGELKTYPNYLNPAGITLERTAKAILGGSFEAGSITQKSVIGLLTSSCGSNAYTNSTLLPALAKKYGFKVVIEQLRCFGGVGDLGTDTSQIQSAVLKFRSEGVTDVFALTGSEGFVVSVFAQSAEQQQYYPKYLVSSNLFPWSNAGGGQIPQKALDTMRGFGWTPYIDTGDRNKPGAEAASQRLCTDLDPTKGNLAAADPRLKWNAVHFFYAECDELLLLGKLLQASGGSTTIAALARAYEQVVPRYSAAAAYDGLLSASAGKHDAPARMQGITYTKSCSCFTATGRRLPIPA